MNISSAIIPTIEFEETFNVSGYYTTQSDSVIIPYKVIYRLSYINYHIWYNRFQVTTNVRVLFIY